MREDVVTPPTARRLAAEGLIWKPQIGDWLMVMGGEHTGETQAGLWLVTGLQTQTGQLAVVDAAGQWQAVRISISDCLWTPTAGKLKTWLRALGYRVATGEASATMLLGATVLQTRHVCRLTREGETDHIDGEGSNEAEALADAILRILGAATANSRRGIW